MTMNPYQSSPLADQAENTSGKGKFHTLPPGVAGWSWGALVLSWLWALFNGCIATILPVVLLGVGINLTIRFGLSDLVMVKFILGFLLFSSVLMPFMLAAKGREWAWQNRRWESVERFRTVQRPWNMAVLVLFVLALGVILISIFQARQADSLVDHDVAAAKVVAQAVGQHIQTTHTIPKTIEEAGAALPPTIRSITINPQNGTMTIMPKASNLAGKAFYLAPRYEANGQVAWRCLAGEIGKHRMPHECRYDAAEDFQVR